MSPDTKPMQHRRHFLKSTFAGTAGLIALPNLFTGSLFGATSPGKRVQVAQIGCGRMGLEDMEGVLNVAQARVVAVCELDTKRAAEGKRRTARNGFKGGHLIKLRQLNRMLSEAMREQRKTLNEWQPG